MPRWTLAAIAALALAASGASAQTAPPRDPNFGRGERVSGETFATRSPVIAPHGAAATAHPLATQTAIDVLRNGGSAIDAAIAANALLGLVEPTGNGVGGDIFVIVWDPRTQRLYGYNGSGRSPRGLSFNEMRRQARRRGDPEHVPSFGAASVSVPGTVDGWFALHERFGRTPMADLLAPAIRYAREGAPIPQTSAMYWVNNERRLEREFAAGRLEEIENARLTYFCGDTIIVTGYERPSLLPVGATRAPIVTCGGRRVPDGHTLFANPDLANTLELIARDGRDAYYRGPIARRIDSYMRRIGGWLRYEDLAMHQGEWVDPVCVPYRDVEVCEIPPNSQGVAALQTLRILDGFNLREMGFLSADSLHTQIEATRLAFADRAQFYGDPAFTHFDVRRLLTDQYTAERRVMISNDHAMPPPPHAELRIDGDTTYLTTADADGMMVSLIQSNYRGMGSGLVPDGLGFMLQDRGELFSLERGHPNQYRPGRRPFQTIIPAFALRNGQPWLAFGVMGGDMQPQGHVQIIVNLVDYGLDLQAAGDAARYRFYGGAEPTGDAPDGVGFVAMENGVPADVRAELERRGHRIRPADGAFGGYQAIMRNANGVYEAATEMRKDGTAGGY
jgi:gamma-glutamyltranspeptidase/glutathione hydrolase